MSNNTTSTLSGQYQIFFSKKLLSSLLPNLIMNQFAVQTPLPKNAGAKQVSWFYYDDADAANVQTLAEGVKTSTTRDLTLSSINKSLTQYGETTVLTDILTNTDLFNALNRAVGVMGDEAAIHHDNLIRTALVAGGTKIYAQGSTDFTTLRTLQPQAGKWISADGLGIATRLKKNKAKRIGGSWVGVVGPEVSQDIQKDPDWKEAAKYAGSKQLFNGELGELNGVRYVETNNNYIEAGTEGTYDSTGNVFATFYLGAESVGSVALTGDSPMSPKMYVLKDADKSDPANQLTYASWKKFAAASILRTANSRVYKSLSSFNANAFA
jgi:N4-gp56 family major capsid protein